MSYDNTGKVSMWSNESYTAGGKQPRFKGMAYAPYDMKAGEAMEVALWDNDSEHPKAPALTGKLDRKREAQAPQAQPEPALASNEVPF